MCMICERIRAIKNGTNPYFVQELETGYVVLGDHQHFKGYTLFLCKQHAAELFCLERAVKSRALQRALECDLTEEMIAEIKRVILRREITG